MFIGIRKIIYLKSECSLVDGATNAVDGRSVVAYEFDIGAVEDQVRDWSSPCNTQIFSCQRY